MTKERLEEMRKEGMLDCKEVATLVLLWEVDVITTEQFESAIDELDGKTEKKISDDVMLILDK